MFFFFHGKVLLIERTYIASWNQEMLEIFDFFKKILLIFRFTLFVKVLYKKKKNVFLKILL